MPRPGFYNDNEYRAYPFVHKDTVIVSAYGELPVAGVKDAVYITRDTDKKYYWTGQAYVEITNTTATIQNSVVVDAGFIMGLDARFNPNQHSIWLSAINKTGSTFEFVFRTNATPVTLSFFRNAATAEWINEYAESAPDPDNPCATEPVWSGFLATSNLSAMPAAANTQFIQNAYQIEPALIQNLDKGYLRSISLGNYQRVKVPPCDVTNANNNRPIVLNARCLKGDIRLKEGYNCLITQTDRSKELLITAAVGSGIAADTNELCQHGGEVPLYPDEPSDEVTGFFSGGPACNQLVSTINGLGGPNVNIIGGPGVNILINDDGALVVQKKPNAQNTCT
jgi:hypothetical protein